MSVQAGRWVGTSRTGQVSPLSLLSPFAIELSDIPTQTHTHTESLNKEHPSYMTFVLCFLRKEHFVPFITVFISVCFLDFVTIWLPWLKLFSGIVSIRMPTRLGIYSRGLSVGDSLEPTARTETEGKQVAHQRQTLGTDGSWWLLGKNVFRTTEHLVEAEGW